ncbi:hypothetical protein JCM6882_008365 [Rhodosporidiobolus microsporus]
MDSLGIGKRTPGSGRKISHSDYVRAIAAADTPLRDTLNTTARSAAASSAHEADDKPSEMAPPASTETPARRRRSRVDRTPAQVKAVLTERKRRSSAGLLKPAKELTPGGLLRALSRMPDLPPPTPEEVEPEPTSHTLAASSSSRRDSYLPRRSSGLASESAHPSSDQHLFSPEPRVEAKQDSTSPRSTLSAQDADVSLPSQRLSRSFSHRSSMLSPARSEGDRTRRSSIASVASVEAARRASNVPEDLSRFLVRRRRMTDLASEKGGDESMMLGEGGDVSTYSVGAGGRFSMGSELGRDLSFAPTDIDALENASVSDSRLSLASAYGDLSAGRLSLPVSLADGEDVDAKDDVTGAAYEASFAEGDFAEDFPQDDFGGGFDDEHFGGDEADVEEDLADRIPWVDKGKGRASDVQEGDDEVWTIATQGAGFGFDDVDTLPTPPALAKIALNRKKRLLGSTPSKAKRLKKQRYTRSGEPVPDLPRSKQKALFQHFLGPNVRMEESAVEALMDASQDFFAALMEDASASANRSGRTSVINENDLVRAMQDQHLLTSKIPLPTLARQLGVDRELQSVIDGLKLGGSRSKRGGQGKKKRALEDVEEEEEPGEEHDEEEEEEPASPPPKRQKKRAPKPAPAKPVEPVKAKAKRRRSSAASTGSKTKRAVSGRRKSVRKEEGPLDDSSADEGNVFSD